MLYVFLFIVILNCFVYCGILTYNNISQIATCVTVKKLPLLSYLKDWHRHALNNKTYLASISIFCIQSQNILGLLRALFNKRLVY